MKYGKIANDAFLNEEKQINDILLSYDSFGDGTGLTLIEGEKHFSLYRGKRSNSWKSFWFIKWNTI